MSIEAIKTVVAAEADAERQRGEALVEAKRIVAAAEAAGKDLVQNAKDTAEAKVQALYREAESQGKEAAEKTAGEARDKRIALESGAETRLERAAAIITEKVVSAQ